MTNDLAKLGMMKRESDANVLAAQERLKHSQAMNPMLQQAQAMQNQYSQQVNPLLINSQTTANAQAQQAYELAQQIEPYKIGAARELQNQRQRAAQYSQFQKERGEALLPHEKNSEMARAGQRNAAAGASQALAQKRKAEAESTGDDSKTKAQIEGIVKLGSIAQGVKGIGPEGSQERSDYVNSIIPHIKKLDAKYGFGVDFERMLKDGVSDEEIDQISQLSASLETTQEGEYFAPVSIETEEGSVLYQPGKSNQGRVVTMGGEALKPAVTAQQESNQIKQTEKKEKYEKSRMATIDKSNNVLKAIDRARNLSGFFTTGVAGRVTGAFGSEDVKELQGALNTIGANLAFEELQSMRENSPTGGALGGIALGELELLKATIASIDPNMGHEALGNSLDIIQEKMEKVKGLANGTISVISSTEEFEKLPAGAIFIDRDSGETMQK